MNYSLSFESFKYEKITPTVGSLIIVDDWRVQYWQKLMPETWEKADFRMPTGYENPKGTPAGRGLIESLACKVRVTGRKVMVHSTRGFYECKIRVEITFIGDGEADTIVHGWMRVD